MKRRDARALDHKTLEEIRIRAVERVQSGESPEVVIQALGCTRSCIYTWLARYRAGGWGALKARALKGRPLKIRPAQMRWLYQTVVGKSPLQFRFEFALWTREMIRLLLREQFQLKLSGPVWDGCSGRSDWPDQERTSSVRIAPLGRPLGFGHRAREVLLYRPILQ